MRWKEWEGRVIARRFHLRRYLGGTERSAVFLTETGDGGKAAVKLIRLDFGAAQAWALRRKLAARLSHPGLLPLLDFGVCEVETNNLVFAEMEYADEDLSLVLPTRALDAGEVREVAGSITETLEYLHREGFVHGRLTPGNILACEDRIKISSERLLRSGETFDDPSLGEYSPPESKHGLTPASDVWSLGIAIIEMLTQRPPAWDRGRGVDPVVPPHLPAPFLEIARRALRVDPRHRCSMADVISILSGQTPSRRSAPVVPPKPVTSAAAAPQKRRLAFWSIGALAGILLAGAVINGVRSSPPVVTQAANPTPVPAQEAPPKPAPPIASKPSPVATKPLPAAKPSPVAPKDKDTASVRTKPAIPIGPTAGEATERPDPQVPADLLANIKGTIRVSVRVRINSAGNVIDAELVSNSASRYFDRIALQTAKQWKFQPATNDGEPVESSKVVRFRFSASGATAAEATR